MVERRAILFHEFGEGDPLHVVRPKSAMEYIRRYLDDLDCKVVIEEPRYFDRDYLDEFAAFYARSARGYTNICKRLHFFGDANAEALLRQATEGDPDAAKALEGSYLGFAVIRPFKPPLFGRTVLRWYREDAHRPGRRVTAPSRRYSVHLVGVKLEVCGLAWQAQDAAVGACATIALWTMLHSSAFDDQHAVPTTAAITVDAHKDTSFGSRIFPSTGLNSFQLTGAINAQKLSPIVVAGDGPKSAGKGFSRARFLTTCAALLRSRYPVVLMGKLDGEGHAICATGFREPGDVERPTSGRVHYPDADIEHIYVHDDNLGPGVRCRVEEDADGRVLLVPKAPPPRNPNTPYADPTAKYPTFRPLSMVVAAHEDIRITPDGLHDLGTEIADLLMLFVRTLIPEDHPSVDLRLQTRFIGVREYMSTEIAAYGLSPDVLGTVRFDLAEVTAMSLHLGLVQISIAKRPMLHVLYDTTDNERFRHAFAHVAFEKRFVGLAVLVAESLGSDLGVSIEAF